MDAYRRMYSILIDAYGAGALTRVLLDETKGKKHFATVTKKDLTLRSRAALLLDIVDADKPAHETLARHEVSLGEAKRIVHRFTEVNAGFFAARLTPMMAALYFIFFTTIMALINVAMNDDSITQVLTSAAVGGVVFAFIMTILFRKNSTSSRTVEKMNEAFLVTFVEHKE